MKEFWFAMSLDRLSQIEEWLKSIPQAPYPIHSRIHPIKFLSNHLYIKRDDELGFGLSGSKVRKYRTLIPYLINSQIKELVLIGSLNSNHVLSMVQLLIENDMIPTLFLRGDPKRATQGNALYTRLFVDDERIHWFSKSEWKNVEIKAQEYVRACDHNCLMLPEGGNLAECLPGALSLPLDIIKNEKENLLHFDDVFIDSGTGLMAIALILGFAWLKKNTTVQVMLMAGNEDYFLQQLKYYHDIFCRWTSFEISFPTNFELNRIKSTKGFGKIDASLFKFIGRIAKTEGFLTDPIYSAKLLIEARNMIEKKSLQKNTLIIHSGGTITLAGFQDQLLQSLS